MTRLDEICKQLVELRLKLPVAFMAWHKTWTVQYIHCVENEGRAVALSKSLADNQCFMLRDQLETTKAEIAALEEERDHLRLIMGAGTEG